MRTTTVIESTTSSIDMLEQLAQHPPDASKPVGDDMHQFHFEEYQTMENLEPSFWDEATIVERRREASVGLRNMESQKKSMKSSSIGNEKSEPFVCQFPGCTRRFINKTELTNHTEVLHQSDHNTAQVSTTDELSTDREVDYKANDRNDGANEDHIIDEVTIKAMPMPVTAASLEVLNSSSDGSLARSMENLSMADSPESDVQSYAASMLSYGTTYSVLDEAEEAPVSEVAEQDSSRIQLPVRILLCLWMKLIVDFSRRFSSGLRQQAPYPGSNNHQSSASQSRESLGGASVASSQQSGTRSIKRQRPSDDGEDENGRKNNKMRKNPGNSTPEQNRPLACPFNKHDNYTFGGDANNTSYHVCSTWSDIKTAYFKQHLLRTHCMPVFHCDRCGLDCKNQASLRVHNRAEPPCAVKELDRQKIMPEIQEELGLRSRNVVGLDRMSYWFKVYDTIFGAEERLRRPVEPYYEGPSHEILQRFIHFSELRLPDVIQRSRQILQLGPEAYSEHDTQLTRTILQEAGQEFMAALKNTQPVDLREVQQRNAGSAASDDLGERTVVVKDEGRRLEPQASRDEPPSVEDWIAPPNLGDHHATEANAYQTFVPMQTFNLPERPIANAAPAMPDPYQQEQFSDISYSTFNPHDYDYAPFLQHAGFDATIESADMYGSGTLNAHDIEGYHFVENPARPRMGRRERTMD